MASVLELSSGVPPELQRKHTPFPTPFSTVPLCKNHPSSPILSLNSICLLLSPLFRELHKSPVHSGLHEIRSDTRVKNGETSNQPTKPVSLPVHAYRADQWEVKLAGGEEVRARVQ